MADSIVVELEMGGERGLMRFVLGQEVSLPNFMNILSFLPDYTADQVRENDEISGLTVGSRAFRYELRFEKGRPVKAWSVSKAGKKKHFSTYGDFRAVSITLNGPALPAGPSPSLEPLPVPIAEKVVEKKDGPSGFISHGDGTFDYPDHTMFMGPVDAVARRLGEISVETPTEVIAIVKNMVELLAGTVVVRAMDDRREPVNIRVLELFGVKVDAVRLERVAKELSFPIKIMVGIVVWLESDGRVAVVSPIVPVW